MEPSFINHRDGAVLIARGRDAVQDLTGTVGLENAKLDTTLVRYTNWR